MVFLDVAISVIFYYSALTPIPVAGLPIPVEVQVLPIMYEGEEACERAKPLATSLVFDAIRGTSMMYGIPAEFSFTLTCRSTKGTVRHGI